MTITVQCVPNDRLLGNLIASANKYLCLCSPFVTLDGVEMVLRASAKIRLITKATAANLSTKALDANALRRMLDAGAEVRSIPNLHAKIYLIDGHSGVVTSSNLTGSGLYQNVELGLYFSEEEGIYQTVSAAFERFWARSVQVTVEGLERLTGISRVTTFDRGVWRKRIPEVADEPLLPAPAIGFLEIPEIPVSFSPEAEQTVVIKSNDISPTADESGDLFGVLPQTSLDLLDRLRSTQPPVVQATLNVLNLASPIYFRSWLASLPESDLLILIDPSNVYPYKIRVLERIINDGSPLVIVALVRAITADSSNEAQFQKYFPILMERLDKHPNEWGSTIAPSLLAVAREVATLVRTSNATVKNFARPNLDRLCTLLTHAKLGTKFQAEVVGLYESINSVASPQTNKIPSFQTIKRTRESMGDAFRDWVFAYLGLIERGEWDECLSSLMSLFKELGKITLSSSDLGTIRTVAATVRSRLDASAVKHRDSLLSAADEWERQIPYSWLNANRRHFQAARADLVPLGQQAVSATGRWVSLYGQCIKSGHAPKNNLMKDIIDWLTTYLAVRKILTGWIEGGERR